MGELQFSILWSLLSYGGDDCQPIESATILNAFQPNCHKKAKMELKELIARGYVNMAIPSDKTISQNPSINQVCINPQRYEDVKRLVNPTSESFVREIKPIEEQIPSGYEKKPFLRTEGSHRVKGVIDSYYFYKKLSDSNFVTVFLISDSKKKSTIHLGSIYNRNSLYRKSLEQIDQIFSTRVFTKAQMRKLGPDIVGNRQPAKALIDIMLHEDYIIKIDDRHYQRAPKSIPPIISMDNFIHSNITIVKKFKEKIHET